MPKIGLAYRWPYSQFHNLWAFLIGTRYSKSVTTVALICVVAFRTAPPTGGLSCCNYEKFEISKGDIHYCHADFKDMDETFSEPKNDSALICRDTAN